MFKPLLLLLTGPGGAGKTTLANLICALPRFQRHLSMTTRQSRAIAGPPEYLHVSRAEFANAILADELVDVSMAPNGVLYGMTRPNRPLDGNATVAVTSASGCGVIRERLKVDFEVRVILLDATDLELEARMSRRGDTEFQRRQRLALAQLERQPIGGVDLLLASESPVAALEQTLRFCRAVMTIASDCP